MFSDFVVPDCIFKPSMLDEVGRLVNQAPRVRVGACGSRAGRMRVACGSRAGRVRVACGSRADRVPVYTVACGSRAGLGSALGPKP